MVVAGRGRRSSGRRRYTRVGGASVSGGVVDEIVVQESEVLSVGRGVVHSLEVLYTC
jgi:hypothetical protein